MLFKKPTKKLCGILKRRYRNQEWYKVYGPAIDHYSMTACFYLGVVTKTALLSYIWFDHVKPRLRYKALLMRSPNIFGGNEEIPSHYSLPVYLYPRKKEFKDFKESHEFINEELDGEIMLNFRLSDYWMNGPLGFESSHKFTDAFFKDLVKKKIDETHFALSIPINYGFDPEFDPQRIKNMADDNKSLKLVFDFDGQIIPK